MQRLLRLAPAPALGAGPVDQQLAVEIVAVHARSRRTYGSPRVQATLRAKGFCVGKKRVERLMRQGGVRAERKRPFRTTTDSRHDSPIAPNRLARDFTAEAPNRVWVTDVTAVRTQEGWLFVAVMLDLFARRAVGWATSAVNDTDLALAALESAVRQRKPRAGLVHHSDRGSPYASARYRAALTAYGMVASMSRKGDCWDNAVAESFFAPSADHDSRPVHRPGRDLHRRLHRELLQHRAAPLSPRLPQPDSSSNCVHEQSR